MVPLTRNFVESSSRPGCLGFGTSKKSILFGAQIDLAFTGQDAGPGVEHKGLAGGNAVLDVELDDGTFDLFCFFGSSPEMDDLLGKIQGEQIEIFGQVPFTHHRTDCAIQIRHEAVNRISLCYSRWAAMSTVA